MGFFEKLRIFLNIPAFALAGINNDIVIFDEDDDDDDDWEDEDDDYYPTGLHWL